MNQIIEQDMKQITNADLPWEMLKDKTVLVTGASGMLASYMVETLLYLGVRVIALVRDRCKAQERFGDRVRITTKDIRYPVWIDEPIDYIIHAASQSTRTYYDTDPVGTLEPNVLGTYNLLNLARQKGAKMVYFSTDVAELDLKPTDSWACYAIAKKMGETICDSFYRQYGVENKIVRMSHTYGPGMRLDEERIFAKYTNAILTDGILDIYGSGENTKPFCYLADTILGILTVLLKGLPNHPYNIGADHTITINELAERLMKLFPERDLKIVHTDTEYNLIHKWPLDITEIKELGWEPTTSIEDGFRKVVNYYETK